MRVSRKWSPPGNVLVAYRPSLARWSRAPLRAWPGDRNPGLVSPGAWGTFFRDGNSVGVMPRPDPLMESSFYIPRA